MTLKTGKHYKHILCNIIPDNNDTQILNLPRLFSDVWSADGTLFPKQLWVSVYIKYMYMPAIYVRPLPHCQVLCSLVTDPDRVSWHSIRPAHTGEHYGW